jgi:hypothetical protein
MNSASGGGAFAVRAFGSEQDHRFLAQAAIAAQARQQAQAAFLAQHRFLQQQFGAFAPDEIPGLRQARHAVPDPLVFVQRILEQLGDGRLVVDDQDDRVSRVHS